MPVLRLLLIVLVLLNLLALATGQGWLGTSVPPGEPERLTNQINPEVIVLLPSRPAPPSPSPATPAPQVETPLGMDAAPPAAPETNVPEAALTNETPAATAPPSNVADQAAVCLAFNGLSPHQADTIEHAALSISPALAIAHETIEPASGWWVRLPPSSSLQAAERQVRALRELGIKDLFIVREAGPNQYAISLGLFRTEASARQHQSDLEARRVHGTEIVVRTPAVVQVEASGPTSLIDLLAERVASDVPDANPGECPQ